MVGVGQLQAAGVAGAVLAAGAAAVLIFIVVPWSALLTSLSAIHFGVAGH